MSKQYFKLFICIFLLAMALTACGKKKEVSPLPVAEEIPIEEEAATQVVDNTVVETEEETEESKEETAQATTPKKVASSTPKKSAAVTTRSTATPRQSQAVAEANVEQTQTPAPAVSNVTSSTTSGASDESSNDKSDSKADNKSESNSDSKQESGSTSQPTVTPESEYPLVDADPMAKNTEVLNGALWRERLNGNQMFFLPVKDFYFASKDVTPAQMKQEIDSLIGKVPAVKNISYVTTQTDGVDLNSYVTVYVEDAALFGSRQAFDIKYEQAKNSLIPKEQEYVNTREQVYSPDMACYLRKIVLASLNDEEYAKLQLAIYECLLSYALTCDSQPEEIIYDRFNYPTFSAYCDVSYKEIAEFFETYDEIYHFFEYYDFAQTEEEKIDFLIEFLMVLEGCAPDMCFWLKDISIKDAQTLRIKFSMFPVYETVLASDGSVTIDKMRYKTIATLAKEVDDKLNQVVADVVEPDMSMFAKEYALFHYCDTFYEYDGGDSLGGTYAIGDNPYTIGVSIDSETRKKDSELATFSTQNEFSIYTTALTGWGVCEGHAFFFHALCTKAGIRCDHEEEQGHAWNVVRINGKTYLVDAGKRAPFPHFNITHEWNSTYQVVDALMYGIICDDERYANASSPIPLYQAGYVEETTQQDGEWVYYINFDDNGSLYKINVDGSGNTKVCNSGTTLPEAYAKLTTNETWEGQWANAQYGSEYRGEGYSNSEAMQYRFALGHMFHLEKENGNIIYKVDNISKTEMIPLTQKKDDIIDLNWYQYEEYINLGIIKGVATVDTAKSSGDYIDKIVVLLDGIEYPVTEVTESGNGQRVDFTFRLPTDRGMENYDLELLALSANGGVERKIISTQGLHPTGIKECYLWNGKYYSIEGITAKEGLLAIYINRYTEDGQPDGTATISYRGYRGADDMDISFITHADMEGVFSVLVDGGECYNLQLVEDERLAIAMPNKNYIYIHSVEEFCHLAESFANGNYQNATIELRADLDFSDLPGGCVSIGAEGRPFRGKFYGNNHKIIGWTGNNGIFGYLEYALIQDVYISDCRITGGSNLGIMCNLIFTDVHNLWVENSEIQGTDRVGIIAFANKCNISDVFVSNVKVSGDECVGGLCGVSSGTTIDGVQILGTKSISGTNYVGGIVGECSDPQSEIANCLSEVDVISGQGFTGGIVGYAVQMKEIRQCMNFGDIEANGTEVGGIVGCITRDSKGIYHVENYGTVRGKQNVGGIAGAFQYCQILDTAVNYGKVTGSSQVGGITGFMGAAAETSMRFCLNKGEVSGDKTVGEICGQYTGRYPIYNSLCTPWEQNLTTSNMSLMVGGYNESVKILTDTGYMPYEAGRGAYCMSE